MSDFKAKMHQIRFRLRLCPRPRWGIPGLQIPQFWTPGLREMYPGLQSLAARES